MKQFATARTALLAAGLAACTISAPKTEENMVPVDYRPKLLEQLHRQLPDPTGIRDAFIAEPALKPVEGNTNRYVACVRFTPKDENGQYSGSKELAGIYHAGQLMHLISATPELCRGAPYQPFPELQKLCREIRCPA
jgi:hypothetical protein